ncbi:MAG: hypothetical protein QNJ44_09905 [Rhodobacter sp.]|nr:hypothetical protein [Rhodobacter sp.]
MTVLTGIAGEIAVLIGEARAARLLAALGGTQITIPAQASGSSLARIVGEDAAARMIVAFGPGKLTLPMATARGRGAVKRRAVALLAEGRSLRDVALTCNLHTRTVSRYREELRGDDPGLGPLFAWSDGG